MGWRYGRISEQSRFNCDTHYSCMPLGSHRRRQAFWNRVVFAIRYRNSEGRQSMLNPVGGSDAGKRLRAERERLQLSMRDVQRLSYELAQKRGNNYYYISHSWLADIEAGKFKPNLFKLYTLSVIYKHNLDEILALFGFDLREMAREPGMIGSPRTHLVQRLPGNPEGSIVTPLEIRTKVDVGRTNLVSRMFESWGEIPIGLLQQMNLRNSLVGYIGTEDYTLYPLIRPGSFVQIDSRQTKIASNWPNESERPIYFVELRNGYVCSWCELHGGQLLLIPTPQSREQSKHVRYPGEAEVLGRVTAVTMCIAEPPVDRSQQGPQQTDLG